jgi:hypothetical protein
MENRRIPVPIYSQQQWKWDQTQLDLFEAHLMEMEKRELLPKGKG